MKKHQTGQPQVTVLVGPTAVGKGTVMAALRQEHPEISYSVSATTRLPRPGEVDGVHYFFVTRERFKEMVDAGMMLEWAEVHGLNYYGTPREPVEAAIAAGRPVLIEVDLAGARQIRASMPQARHVFLAPPSFEVLVERLTGRGTESEQEQARRLETALTEMAAQDEFDQVIVNDTVDNCVRALAEFMGLD
ncbi:guanylate kinase [Boudabousia marimammalium]|uniref:Guanylate kinase n=1 Tax=Boudabousia marimammalium TaxID=156892 RepID=A0A1Q5PRI2_9ACTO|nr:guanylate kinase [Boudabousia marimammalium]OKL50099.1 guanylate kinase [Boudabousia marimammalium]